MARPPSVPYKIAGSMLFVGDLNQVQVCLVDIPREAIDLMALKFLAAKMTKIAASKGYGEAQRLATSVCKNGRVTRTHIDRLPEEAILKACLVNYAREKQGVGPLDLTEAATEFDTKVGDLSKVSTTGEPYKAARKRTDEILFSYRR